MKTPSELFALTEKVAVVIGGTGELCGAIAEGLARAGATVVLIGRDPKKAEARIQRIQQFGGRATFFACDTTSKQALEHLQSDILAGHDRVDILVNGAGVNSATTFLEVAEEEFDRIMQVNFKSVFLACQIFGQTMIEQSAGSIINIGSVSGIAPLSRVFTYSASKAALHNLSKNLAREWAAKGVRVNVLVPGFFPAEQNRKILSPDRVASIMAHTPMARFGKPDELIGAALFLASDAGSFVTGIELEVDGGFGAITI